MKLRNEYEFETKINLKKHTVTVIAKVIVWDKKILELNADYIFLLGRNSPLQNKFIGVARWKENEEFNLKEGEYIAKQKALRQANRYYYNILNETTKIFLKKVEEIQGLAAAAALQRDYYNRKILERALPSID